MVWKAMIRITIKGILVWFFLWIYTCKPLSSLSLTMFWFPFESLWAKTKKTPVYVLKGTESKILLWWKQKTWILFLLYWFLYSQIHLVGGGGLSNTWNIFAATSAYCHNILKNPIFPSNSKNSDCPSVHFCFYHDCYSLWLPLWLSFLHL